MVQGSVIKPKVYFVSEFIAYLKDFLKEKLGHVIIQGEVTGFHITQGKFVWFDLKDTEGILSCFMMKWELRVPLEDGIEIKVLGLPQLFVKSGRFHIRVEEIELVGLGALQKAYELLKKKLEKEGLFAPERKRTLTPFPETIGLITSPDAAAYTDVLRILKNRWSGLTIYFYPVAVQGMGSVKQIVHALTYFNREKSVDAIILTRGGGSLEDLQNFNSEDVARAIFASSIPVVCGVGHERDESLADYVADVRASTPSNAAELTVPDKREVRDTISRYREDIISAYDQKLLNVSRDVTSLMERMAGRITERIVHGHVVIGGRITRLADVYERLLMEKVNKIEALTRLMKNIDPRALLKKGYSLLWKNGMLIRKLSDVAIGDRVRAQVSDGSIYGSVTKKEIL